MPAKGSTPRSDPTQRSDRLAAVIAVCIACATGWTGSALVRAVREADDLELVSAVARSAAGRDLGEALGGDALGVPVFAKVADALPGVDVLVDYTSATAVRKNTMAAIDEVGCRRRKLGPDCGGLRRDRCGRSRALGRRRRIGVLLGHRRDVPGRCPARGSPPAVLGGDRLRERTKPDVPSGTARRSRSVSPRSASRRWVTRSTIPTGRKRRGAPPSQARRCTR